MAEPIFSGDIAVIGMAGRFPGSSSLDEFWRNLQQGKELISTFSEAELKRAGVPEDRMRAAGFVARGGVVENPELFDAAFFGFSPREAEFLDPQQRLFLECTWEALESAAYPPSKGSREVGVFAGASISTYFIHSLIPLYQATGIQRNDVIQAYLANDKDFLATRVSYKLNLSGPSVGVQTACSTSLVAIHLACRSLLAKECEMALAGGATVSVPHKAGYTYHSGDVLSPDGHCRPFDASAEGTVFSDGVGCVLLKPLENALRDGDNVICVIKATAINNDGSTKLGFVAPSIEGQTKVVEKALAGCNLNPRAIGYVEAHGTGTRLGDPVEVVALTRAFRKQTADTAFCALGSLKSNVGHMDAAAGVGGLIKAALCLQHRRLVPSINFQVPNHQIGLESSPFYVNTQAKDWESKTPRFAAVTSLGMGGTNAHAILQEPPAIARESSQREWHPILLSAKTESALLEMSTRLAKYLTDHPEAELADIAHTLLAGRARFPVRRSFAAKDRQQLIDALLKDPRKLSSPQAPGISGLGFLFPGQGAQYVGMGRELFEKPGVFRTEMLRCAEILTSEGGPAILSCLYPDPADEKAAEAKLNETQFTQPALFAIEYALAKQWMKWGMVPDIMLGHSIGEYVAACLAGVFSLEDALRIVTKRAEAIARIPSGEGAMLSVSLPAREVVALAETGVAIAADNGPNLSVASGPRENIERLEAICREKGVSCRLLFTSHAFHSEQMHSAAPMLEAFVSTIKLAPPKIPFVSNVSGRVITDEEATNPRYWAQHLLSTVQFRRGLQILHERGISTLLEVGPGRTLSMLSAQQPLSPKANCLASLPHPQEERSAEGLLVETFGNLFSLGFEPRPNSIYDEEKRRRIPLPTYPFERKRYWIDPPSLYKQNSNSDQESAEPASAPATAASSVETQVMRLWRECLGVEDVASEDGFFAVGGDSLAASRIIVRLRDQFGVHLSVAQFYGAQTPARIAALIENGENRP